MNNSFVHLLVFIAMKYLLTLPDGPKTDPHKKTSDMLANEMELGDQSADKTVDQKVSSLKRLRAIFAKPSGASTPMPSQEPERSAEAVRRVLPELRKLDRYERRAAARRDRAVLHLRDRKLI